MASVFPKIHLTKLNQLSVSTSTPFSSCSPYPHPINVRLPDICKAPKAFDAVQVVTDCKWDQFVIASDNLVVVSFWAPQFEACLGMNEIAKEYVGRIECYKMNIEDYPNISKQINIVNIPSLVLFKDGEMKESIIGDVSKSALKATIHKYLDN